MKTRIRMTEQNNGTIKYICECDSFNTRETQAIYVIIMTVVDCFIFNFYSISIIITVSIIQLISIIILKHYTCWDIMNNNEGLNIGTYNQAIFDNLQDAKVFIDFELKKESDRLSLENGKKIKKETIIKHP